MTDPTLQQVKNAIKQIINKKKNNLKIVQKSFKPGGHSNNHEMGLLNNLYKLTNINQKINESKTINAVFNISGIHTVLPPTGNIRNQYKKHRYRFYTSKDIENRIQSAIFYIIIFLKKDMSKDINPDIILPIMNDVIDKIYNVITNNSMDTIKIVDKSLIKFEREGIKETLDKMNLTRCNSIRTPNSLLINTCTTTSNAYEGSEPETSTIDKFHLDKNHTNKLRKILNHF